jgi:mono/diheme cytochrome c family protein
MPNAGGLPAPELLGNATSRVPRGVASGSHPCFCPARKMSRQPPRQLQRIGAAFAIALLVFGGAASAEAASDPAPDVQPLFQNYCFKCHGNGKKKGGVSLDGFTSPEALKDQKMWSVVRENVTNGQMPPDDEDKQPAPAERERIAQWIDRVVFALDPDHPDPGRVTLRRLNRVEYNNTIRDLVGVDFEPADDFPADDTGYGFDNIGDALSLPPVLFDRYLAAAEKIMSAAILNDHKPRSQKIPVELGNNSKQNSRWVDSKEISLKVDLPVAGEYVLKMETQSGKVGADFTKVDLKFDGQSVPTKELTGVWDHPDSQKATVRVAQPGAHAITVHVANPLQHPETDKNGKPKVRGFNIRKIELLSPPQIAKAPPSQLKLFAPGGGQRSLDLSARAIISAFAKRAFRRPLASYEIDRLFYIYGQALKRGGNFEQSVQTALTAVLVSPHFLFRGELQPQPDSPKAAYPVNEWALASRLSYFLWSTMPDDALFAQAERGTLRKNLASEVVRMLKDPKAGALVENFASQWLQIRNIRQVLPDEKTYPGWDKALGAAMERETELLFEHIMREDRSVLDLVAADYTFVNERLARHYGIGGVEGDAFVKVKLPANRPGGILGQGSFLTLTSNPTRTSLVKRGRYVLENLLGYSQPPPPAGTPDLDDAKRTELKGTTRQRFEQHRKDPVCASCHARMDPIGFGLENFDGIGAWRDKEGNDPVDSNGQLVTGEKFKGPVELRELLLKQKRGDFLRCVTEKMLTYALGRGLEYYDRPTLDKIASNIDKSGAKFSALVMEIVTSAPFQMRRGEGDHRQFAGQVTAKK